MSNNIQNNKKTYVKKKSESERFAFAIFVDKCYMS